MSLPNSIQAVLDGRERWTVVHADNSEILPLLPAKSVDHVITDPPYSEHVHGKQRRGSSLPDVGSRRFGGMANAKASISRVRELGFEAITQEEMDRMSELASLKARRWVLRFADFESVGGWMEADAAAALDHVRIGVWVKLGSTPQFTGDRPATGAEAIVIAHPKGRKRWNGGGSHALWSHPIVLDRGGHQNRVHTTQKPLGLMLDLVDQFTDPGELVLDPFAGSGTTGVACLRLGRRFIGIERDGKYAGVARERLEAESKGLTLRDARAGQLSLLEAAK